MLFSFITNGAFDISFTAFDVSYVMLYPSKKELSFTNSSNIGKVRLT